MSMGVCVCICMACMCTHTRMLNRQCPSLVAHSPQPPFAICKHFFSPWVIFQACMLLTCLPRHPPLLSVVLSLPSSPTLTHVWVVRTGGDPTPEGTPGGGLARLLAMVMGGLVGGSPHMVSASVMALARLLHEHAQLLEGLAPRLLQTTLLLLRTKSREVVKSVLGFCKVGAPCSGGGGFVMGVREAGRRGASGAVCRPHVCAKAM